MKTSRQWLQAYFEQPLPEADVLADALTFHAFEIESVDNDVLDVKVTANRGHDCLCHRGIAKELSAILNVPMKFDPLREHFLLEPVTNAVSVSIKEPSLCGRYIAGYIRGVKVGPSPAWLRERLESIGQKSINNIVDAANYVMFDLGQPLHAFDAGKLVERDGVYSIDVTRARAGEKTVALDGKEYVLSDSMLVIADGWSEMPIGIAGVKGGAPAAIGQDTQDIIIESANFDGASVRKTAAALRLRTDASGRYEQGLSPELTAYGMRAVVGLILSLAGGELVGFVDQEVKKSAQKSVSVSLAKINHMLGTKLHEKDVEDAFGRLAFAYEKKGDTYTVFAPLERLDLQIPEDLVEEVARIVGYDRVPAIELPAPAEVPGANRDFSAGETAREDLVSKGYSEVFTSAFAQRGDRVIANKVDGVSPYLRATLVDGLCDAYEKNVRNKDLLGLKEIQIFEIGTVWQKGNEVVMLGIADKGGVREEPLPKGYDAARQESATSPVSALPDVRYRPFSKYPFVVRDIALWVPEGTQPGAVLDSIQTHAGELLMRADLFDEFKKGEKISYAFRLVFQSFDKTLTDFDVNERMGSVTQALQEKGFEIR